MPVVSFDRAVSSEPLAFAGDADFYGFSIELLLQERVTTAWEQLRREKQQITVASLCSRMEVLHTRERSILGTRSVRRASGLLETSYPEM